MSQPNRSESVTTRVELEVSHRAEIDEDKTLLRIHYEALFPITDPIMSTAEDGERSLPCKVYQDNFSPGRGNALQAAVASVFGLQLAEVPNFVASPEGYELAIQQFCFDCGRYASLKYSLKDDTLDADSWGKYEGNFCLLRGKSPRGDFGHVVVARKVKKADDGETVSAFEMIHDPHPDETFLDESEPFGWSFSL